MVEFFGNINFGLLVVLQYGNKVHQYYYVEKDPQAQQTSTHHIMMLRQHPELLLVSDALPSSLIDSK
jgi:hypothetical protein